MIFNKLQREKLIEYIDALFAKDKKVKCESVKERRSLNQNAYMHGVVFSIFAIEMGWTMAEAKEYFKRLFLTYKKDNCSFTKETSKLDTGEMELFLESCRVHASKEHQCYIPVPNEVTNEMLMEIYKHEKYLY